MIVFHSCQFRFFWFPRKEPETRNQFSKQGTQQKFPLNWRITYALVTLELTAHTKSNVLADQIAPDYPGKIGLLI